MNRDDARYQIGVEMNYWREFFLKRVKETRGRDELLDAEITTAAILAIGSALLWELSGMTRD